MALPTAARGLSRVIRQWARTVNECEGVMTVFFVPFRQELLDDTSAALRQTASSRLTAP
jgi:hypothetical protein